MPTLQEAQDALARAQQAGDQGAVEFFTGEVQRYLDTMGGAGELVANLATSAVAEPLAGLMGMMTAGRGSDVSAAAVRDVRDRLTYMPRGEAGQGMLQSIGDFLAPIGQAQGAMGKFGADVAGPAGGAAMETVIPAAMTAIPFVPKGVRAFRNKAGQGGRVSAQRGAVGDLGASGWEHVEFPRRSAPDADDYLYHVAPEDRVPAILDEGLMPGQQATAGGGAYAPNSRGRVFTTEAPGVGFWQEKVEAHLFDQFDNPPDTALLRVPRDRVSAELFPDELGTRDARTAAYYSTDTVDGPPPMAPVQRSTQSAELPPAVPDDVPMPELPADAPPWLTAGALRRVRARQKGSANVNPSANPALMLAAAQDALVRAREAGDQNAARFFEGEIARYQAEDDQAKGTESSILDAAGHGATFGFLDEARGVVGGLLDTLGHAGVLGGPGFDQDRARGANVYADADREDYERYARMNPGDALVGEIVGAIPTALLPVGAAARTAGLGAKIATGAGVGAAEGALAGAGSARPGERDVGALQGAGIGAALGGAIPGIAGAAQGLGRFVRPGAEGVDDAARARLAQALGEDNISPEQAQAFLDANRNSVIADVGTGTRGELDVLSNQPGATRGTMYDTLAERSRGAVEDVEQALGGPGNLRARMEAFKAERASTARPLYDAAYQAPTPMTPGLKEIFEAPAVKRMWKSKELRDTAEDIATAEGLPYSPGMFDTELPSTQGLDYLLRAFDTRYAGQVRDNPARARITSQIRKRLADAVADANPKLQQARDYWSGSAPFGAAQKAGKDFWKQTSDEVAEATEDLSGSEMRGYLDGVRQSVGDAIEAGIETGDITKKFRTVRMRRKLNQTLGEEGAQAFYKDIDRLTMQQSTFDNARGGPATARRLIRNAEQDSVIGDAMSAGLDVATGNIRDPQGVLSIGRRVTDILRRVRPGDRTAVRDRLGEMLLNRDPAEQAQILESLLQPGPRAQSILGGPGTSVVLPGLLGGQAARENERR